MSDPKADYSRLLEEKVLEAIAALKEARELAGKGNIDLRAYDDWSDLYDEMEAFCDLSPEDGWLNSNCF